MIWQALAIGLGIFIGQLLWGLFAAIVKTWEYYWFVKPQRDLMKSDLLKLVQQTQLEPSQDDDFRVN